MSNLARQPLQVVEIDIEQCTLTYGNAPCTASGAAGSECFNLYKHCQDQANFDAGTLTLKFSKNQATGIRGEIVYPALQGVTTSPTRIALGKTDRRLGSLGKRARVEVKLKDFRWGDRGIDPYVDTRSYDPATQGTFFGKLRRRYPYYFGRSLRVRNGYVGDTLSSMPTRNYIITEWKGPDSGGNVTIVAQDAMVLLDDEYALCPTPTTGTLPEFGLTDSFTGDFTFPISGAGAQYAASGRVSIGDEILAYTRSGDVMTITARGLDGTTATSHAEGDTVQECYVVENANTWTVAFQLFNTYANVDASLLPYLTEWQDEVSTWLPTLRLTRTVGKPRPVRELLAEIADLGMSFWFDEVANEVKLKVNRPPGYDETFAEINDASNLIEKSGQREDLDDQRLSRVLVWNAYKNALEDTDDDTNYSRLPIFIDADAESALEYNQERVIELFLPWLGRSGDDVLASTIGTRMLDRYRDTPQRLTVDVDVKDRTSVEIADLVEVTTRLIQDEFGANVATEMQVTSVEEIAPGHRLRIVMETYQFSGRYGFFTENSRGDYDVATDFFKEKGTYFSDGTNNFADGTGPYVFF